MTNVTYNKDSMSSTNAQGPKPSTRSRIINHLREHPTATAAEISRAWGLTLADIRYHLGALVEKGLVEVVPRDPKQALRRGRPTLTYRLATGAQPDNLAGLCAALLDQLLRNTSTNEEKSDQLRAAAEFMARDFVIPDSTVQRLNRAVAFLNRLSYQARWEASARGPRVLLRRCPYAVLLDRYPELCTLDRLLIGQLVGMPVKQAARANLQTGDPPTCIFTC